MFTRTIKLNLFLKWFLGSNLSQRKMLWSLNKFSPQFFWHLRKERRISRLMLFTTQIWVVVHFMGKPVVASQMFCQAIRRWVWRICAWWRLLLLRLEFNMFFLSNLSLVIPRRFYTPNALQAKSCRLLVVAVKWYHRQNRLIKGDMKCISHCCLKREGE